MSKPLLTVKQTVLSLTCLSCMSAVHSAPATARPNIVILVADDWGFSDVGAFGSEIATPNVDGLARRGMKFSNFHVAASCSPTRAMLLTGVDNHRNGVGNMPETMPAEHEGKPGYSGVLDDRAVTLASMLKAGGYHTYITGKWHLGKTPDTLPPKRGFERSFIQADSGSDNWEQRPYIFLYDKASWFEQGREATLPENYYSSTFIVEKMLNYLKADSADGKPFFAYLGFQANHIPVQAPRSYIDKYAGRYKDGWTALRKARRERAVALGLVPKDSPMVTMASTENWNALTPDQQRYQQRRMEVYAGMAEAMDASVGRLIAHLKQTGQYDNTVFVFLSDNGAEPSDPYAIPAIKLWLKLNYSDDYERLGGKGAYSVLGPSWASAAASPLNTYKFWAGEGGLRTPLIISGVPGMQKDSLSKTFTHVTDIMPTLIEVAGIAAHGSTFEGKPVEPVTGSSMLALLQGKAQVVHGAEQPIGYELSGNAALFRGDFKLMKNLPPVGDGRWHLYNLALDPGEVNDLRGQQPVLFAQMQSDYAAYAKANGVLPMPEGYLYTDQGQIYALKHVFIPKLLRALPELLTGLVLLVVAIIWRRRRQSRS